MGWRGVAVLGVVLAISGAAGALELPQGWFLEESETSGINDLFLSWYDPASGEMLVAISCQEGYGDVVFTVYMDAPDRAAPRELALVEGETRHAMRAISGEFAGRHSVGGITSFGPELVDLLAGQFSVLVDGVEVGRYSSGSSVAGSGERLTRSWPMTQPMRRNRHQSLRPDAVACRRMPGDLGAGVGAGMGCRRA
jgi:hypothetical protein